MLRDMKHRVCAKALCSNDSQTAWVEEGWFCDECDKDRKIEQLEDKLKESEDKCREYDAFVMACNLQKEKREFVKFYNTDLG